MSSRVSRRPSYRHEFKIGIMCALSKEGDMVDSIFDEVWEGGYGRAEGDSNTYTTGIIADQNVVLVHCPRIASNAAASVATWLKASFTEMKLIIVVGICGAVPKYEDEQEQKQVFLGDLLVSTAVIQFDLGRMESHGFRMKDRLDGLGRSGPLTSGIMAMLQAARNRSALTQMLKSYLQALQRERLDCPYPGAQHDRLYCAQDCKGLECGDQYHELRTRKPEDDNQPNIHFGIFGSSNFLLRSGAIRDELARTYNIIGFEMESSGTWDVCQTVVIKAVSDYADTHKNDIWQRYAAAVAAAGVKAFLAKAGLSDRFQPPAMMAQNVEVPPLRFEDWPLLGNGHTTAIISPNFTILAYGPETPTRKKDATIHIHHLKNGAVKHNLVVKDETQVRSLSFDRRGKLLASSHGGYWHTPVMGLKKRLPVRIRLWCMETGDQEWICQPHQRSTSESPSITMSFNSEGDRLVAVYSSNDLPHAERPSFFVIDVNKREILYKDDSDLSKFRLGLFLPDDRHYFIHLEEEIVIFNADKADEYKRAITGMPVLGNATATFDANGHLLVAYCNGDINIHFPGRNVKQKLRVQSDVSFGKDIRILARFSNNNELVIVVSNHRSPQLFIALPDSRRCKWVPSNGRIAQVLNISHDGQYLAWCERETSNSPCNIRVCNIQEQLRDASMLCFLQSVD